MRYLLGMVILLTACESREAKYERLSNELLLAQFSVSLQREAAVSGKPLCPELSRLPTNEYLRRCGEVTATNRARLALAEREMNRFMSGR